MEILMSLIMVVFVNIILSGDNAVVIALASKALPPEQRIKAIFWGSALAVVLRIILVILATYLLMIPYLRFAGGLALVYIAFHLLTGGDVRTDMGAADSLASAIKTILAADLIMSMDNVLALAGIAHGNWLVLLFGLAVSIPLVIFGAQLLSRLMDRFPVLVYIGAGLIAYTAAEMIISDAKAAPYLESYSIVIRVAITAAVLIMGYWSKRNNQKQKREDRNPANIA
jgi:YjbE family integral membrane protein